MATLATAAPAGDGRTEYPHVVRRPGLVGGRACVEGTRLAVWLLASLWRQGATVDELLAMYPDLTPAAVHSALAYAFDHQAEIDAEIAANRPEQVMAELRRDPNWIEAPPRRFRYRPPGTRRATT